MENLLNFFRVDSLELIDKVFQTTAFRSSDWAENNKELIVAWLQTGEIEAEKIKEHLEIKEFNKKKLKKYLPRFRALTKNPARFAKTLQSLGAKCGVIIVFSHYFKKTRVNASVRWVNNNPLIQLNDRWKSSDIFWFNFFHELGHILLHGKKDSFIEFDNFNQNDKEKEADDFACNTLISSNEYSFFKQVGDFSDLAIYKLADSLSISPDIIAGRLAHDNLKHWSEIQHLREKIVIS